MKKYTITQNRIKKDSSKFTFIDIREKVVYDYGHIKGSINVPIKAFKKYKFDNTKSYVIYSQNGASSAEYELVLDLNNKGIKAYMLSGGYLSFIISNYDFSIEEKNEEYIKSVEYSIRKKFHRELWSPFVKAIKNYDLIKEGDVIACCISGGKDSMLMAKLFEELKRHKKFPFEVKYIVMDPGYSKENRTIIEKNAKKLGINITIFDSPIFDSVFDIKNSPCYLCARMRRGYLYSKAKELGCNKIALGHHFDDVIETILMGMLYGGQVQTMMPKLHSTNFEGMELIRPMYLIREEDIKHWRDYNNLYFIQCACKFTDMALNNNEDEQPSKRLETKNLIKELKKTNPFVETNIFRSVENVNLSTIIEYKKNGVKHSFLDDYDSTFIDD